ncbi:unnamed protein product [Psylliodes chrysocephalus]|uniref:SWIM-type domain-containing protein n=1 Tax=Psylliodes chrysocephalus TaxID=3402493 RepID=A0A9P0D111_9CUCU|nr:unnamed protein product [Psylliodes chrysocephala]
MCSCPVGYNGKHCKHQAAVISKFRILKTINTLTLENKILFYQIATGKEPKKTLFCPLQSPGTIETCFTPEVISPNEVDPSTIEPEPLQEINAVKNLASDIEATKTAWLEYSNTILQHLKNYPEQFLPAVNRHLGNFKKYTISVPSLLSGTRNECGNIPEKDEKEPVESQTTSLKAIKFIKGTNQFICRYPKDKVYKVVERIAVYYRISSVDKGHIWRCDKSDDSVADPPYNPPEIPITEMLAEIHTNIRDAKRKVKYHLNNEKIGRKRLKHTSTWQKANGKSLRNTGEAYLSIGIVKNTDGTKTKSKLV